MCAKVFTGILVEKWKYLENFKNNNPSVYH